MAHPSSNLFWQQKVNMASSSIFSVYYNSVIWYLTLWLTKWTWTMLPWLWHQTCFSHCQKQRQSSVWRMYHRQQEHHTLLNCWLNTTICYGLWVLFNTYCINCLMLRCSNTVIRTICLIIHSAVLLSGGLGFLALKYHPKNQPNDSLVVLVYVFRYPLHLIVAIKTFSGFFFYWLID